MSECKSEHCCQSEESCETETSCGCDCACHASSDEGCSVMESFIDLAKTAKHELLKEKMKKAFEAKIGAKMDKVADVITTAAIACMQNKMAEKKAYEDLQQSLMSIFKN